MKTLRNILWVSIYLLIVPSLTYSQTIENSYSVNQQIAIGGSSLFYVQITGASSKAIISNVEVKFEYVAYGVVQDYVSSRFNKDSDPGTNGGVVLVSQGNLPSGNPGTYGYISFSNWNGQTVINSNYYFRFSLASGSPFTCTINKIYVRVSYSKMLPAPTLVSPTIGGTLLGPPYQFTWQSVSGAGAYQLKIADNVSFTNPIVNDQNISGSATSFQTSASLSYGQTYYWQMRTLNGIGTTWSDWGQYQAFTILDSTSTGPVDDYPTIYKNSTHCDHYIDSTYCPGTCVADIWQFYRRECTSFVAWRINRDAGYTKLTKSDPFQNNSVFGVSVPGNPPRLGDAVNWANKLQSMGYTVDNSPLVGDIAYFNIGHVAYVQSVNQNGTVNIEEYNWYTNCNNIGIYNYRTTRADKYIHIRQGTGGNTAINDVKKNSTTKLYPNPTSSLLIIEFSNTKSLNKRKLSIFNSLGVVISTLTTNESTLTIDMKNYNAGVYMILIEIDGIVETHKIVKE